MTKDKWLDLLQIMEGKFSIDEHFKEGLGNDESGEKDVVIFNSPVLGKVRLEWVERPRFLRENTKYSRRIGSDVKVEKVYDENDKVSYIQAFKWDEPGQDWEEIEVEKTFSF